MTRSHALSLLYAVDRTGHLLLRGTSSLMLLRDAVRLAVHEAGVMVEFAPTSDRRLVDYLAIAGLKATERAATAAVVGLLLGSLLGRPAAGLLVGGVIGAASGAADGIALARKGWRINALREADGTPVLQLVAA